jgi:Fe-S-cluster-containing dehydrogenase component
MAAQNPLPTASMPTVEIPAELTTFEQVKAFIHQTITRRDFNRAVGVGTLGAVAFQFGCSNDPKDATPREVYVANAKGMIVADSVYCVGCRRCETSCTANNLGKAQPYVSNVKVNRNHNWGTQGVSAGIGVGGVFGNFRMVQDTCRQCPHPVPCQVACPNAAIEVVGDLNARVVNEDKCVGCGICVEACPWEMLALDGPKFGEATKSHKCTLCFDSLAAGQERPNCVEACPAGALKFVPWTDRTSEVPPRQVASGQVAPDAAETCKQCH